MQMITEYQELSNSTSFSPTNPLRGINCGGNIRASEVNRYERSIAHVQYTLQWSFSCLSECCIDIFSYQIGCLPNSASMTLTKGAKQLVVQEALLQHHRQPILLISSLLTEDFSTAVQNYLSEY